VSSKRVFLSYSAEESPFVEAVAQALATRGIQPSMAAHGRDTRETAERWQESLKAAIAASDTVVIFLGLRPSSNWVNFEIGAAMGGGSPVLPVYLASRTGLSSPAGLQQQRSIDASGLHPEEVAERIVDAVESV
jgi:hypothetical protein